MVTASSDHPSTTKFDIMAKDAELKEEKKKKRKSDAADLEVTEKKAKKEKRKSLAAEDGEEKKVCFGISNFRE